MLADMKSTNLASPLIAAACVVLALSPWVVMAQTSVLPLSGRNPTFNEWFDQNPKINNAGRILVGLKWAGSIGAFDIRRIAVHLAPALKGQTACVDIATEDGRYRAQNLYDIPASVGDVALLATGRPDLKLSSPYRTDAVAVAARLIRDCRADEAAAFLLPVLGIADGKVSSVPIERARRLIVNLHGEPQQLTVRLRRDGHEIGRAEGCKSRTDAVLVGYSSSCAIELSEPVATGQHELEVLHRQRFETSRTVYPVVID